MFCIQKAYIPYKLLPRMIHMISDKLCVYATRTRNCIWCCYYELFMVLSLLHYVRALFLGYMAFDWYFCYDCSHKLDVLRYSTLQLSHIHKTLQVILIIYSYCSLFWSHTHIKYWSRRVNHSDMINNTRLLQINTVWTMKKKKQFL